ncbi:MAG: hypothetical protein ACI8RD_012242 [Bacillariaceae sp.]|jgi:hypothetical protein
MTINGKPVNHNRKLIRIKKCSTFRLARKSKNTGSLQQFAQTCLRRIFFDTVETSGFITPSTITSQKTSSLELPSLDDDKPSINETSAANRIRIKIKINKNLESIRVNLNPLFDEVADITEE